jgi:hypothetical protein
MIEPTRHNLDLDRPGLRLDESFLRHSRCRRDHESESELKDRFHAYASFAPVPDHLVCARTGSSSVKRHVFRGLHVKAFVSAGKPGGAQKMMTIKNAANRV